MMREGVEVSFVIPVFNSKDSLFKLCEGIEKAVSKLNNYEIIFVDDASTNGDTWPTISSLSQDIDQVKGVRLRKNVGKAAALLCGLKEAKGQYVATLDDDLQQDPSDFHLLWKNNSHDVVIGKLKNRKHSSFKNFLAWVNHLVEIWAYNKPKNLRHSPYKLLKREIIDSILEIKSNKPFLGALICSVTDDIINVDIPHYERKENESGFTLKKMWSVFSNLIFNNSSILLRSVAWLGVGLFLLFICACLIVFFQRVLFGISIHSWVILWLTLCGIGAVLLFSLGIIGEYLIRIISGVEKRPAYFVKERTCKKKL